MTAPTPGTVIAGKYQVERVLGEGGMGVVLSAHHVDLGQRVALKFLQPHLASHPEVVERFLREARAGVKIAGENVVRVTDVGRLENGAPFMVMEFLEGTDLDQEIQARGPLPITEVVDLLLQACLGVAEAHRAGVIHRDLKPANLFISTRSDGTRLLKVLDFGISKIVSNDPTDSGLTKTAMTMGSAYFMSPEQIRASKHVDARADVWALGVILYQALTGALPFEGPTQSAVMANALESNPAPVRQLRPDVPAELEAAVSRCLVKDREQRCPSVAELAAALAPFASARGAPISDRVSRVLGVQSVVAGGTGNRSSSVAAQTDAAFGRTSPGSRPPTVLRFVVGGVGLLAIGVVGAWFVLAPSTEATPAPSAAVPETSAEPVPVPAAPAPAAAPQIQPVSAPAEPTPAPSAIETPAPKQSPPARVVPSKPTVARKPTAVPKPRAQPAPQPPPPPPAAPAAPARKKPSPVDLMNQRH